MSVFYCFFRICNGYCDYSSDKDEGVCGLESEIQFFIFFLIIYKPSFVTSLTCKTYYEYSNYEYEVVCGVEMTWRAIIPTISVRRMQYKNGIYAFEAANPVYFSVPFKLPFSLVHNKVW